MADQKDNEPVILQDGVDADEKFTFSVQQHVLGRKIKGCTYCNSEEVDGELKTTVRLDFDDGGFLVISIATDAEVTLWVSQKDQPAQPISKYTM